MFKIFLRNYVFFSNKTFLRYFFMKIALVGYGKMGKAIEKAAIERKHEVVYTCHHLSETLVLTLKELQPDAIIEFTHPESVIGNLELLATTNIPIVCGTTGWLAHLSHIASVIEKNKSSLIYASNFSVGVNILFKLNQQLAKWMNPYPEYDSFIEEQHHRHKADAPSGTALSLGLDMLKFLDRKENIVHNELINRGPTPSELSIGYIRAGEIIGKHTVTYTSHTDTLSISHHAHNREGFAIGAVIAAEWIQGKQGFFNFADIF